MKLKDLFENQEYTFADWAKDEGVDLNSQAIDCSWTKITSLEGAPTSVGGSFDCSNTEITSLQGAPTSVGGYFYCCSPDMTSLQGAPTSVGGYFCCSCRGLASFQGAPTKVGSDFYCTSSKITSLQNIHHHIHYVGQSLDLEGCPIKSNVLGVLWIGCDEQGRPQPDGKAPKTIELYNKQVEDILNKYLAKIHSKEMTPREALIHAQNELQDANLDEYADL